LKSPSKISSIHESQDWIAPTAPTRVICITARQLHAMQDRVCIWKQCRELLLAAILVAALLLPVRSSAPQQLTNPQQITACDLAIGPGGEDIAVRQSICLIVASGMLPAMRWSNFSTWLPQVRQFYAPQAYSPEWTEAGQPRPQAWTLIDLFEHAGEKGLLAEDYDGPLWHARLQKFSDIRTPPLSGELAAFDVAVTVSAFRYLSDLHRGRVNPAEVRFGLPAKTLDTVRLLRDQIVRSSDVKSVVERLEPAYPGYRRTLKAFELYNELSKQGEDPPLAPLAKILLPGQSYPGASVLADKLRRLGDLPADEPLPQQQDLYAGALVAGVRNFQQRHGLKSDGRIGPDTFQQLSVPLAVRVRQLEFALERFRWLPADLKPPLVVVNIPEFQLRAYEDHHVLTMKVIVGKAFDHQTPVFADQMEYIIFRPYWNVPASIVKDEIVPLLRKRPAYLVKHQMEVVDRQGNVIAAGTVAPETLRRLRAGLLEIRQKPGPHNSLGLVKLVFPNQYDVYLHGTPEVDLFSRARRDFSHGCIRVEDPGALAEWALSGAAGWNTARIRAAINGEQTVQVNLPRSIPVLIVYGTAVVDDTGKIHFYDDVYGLDEALSRALAGPKP
jgi:L,D-transpeptidase YcbB